VAAPLPRGFFDFEDYKDDLPVEMLKRELEFAFGREYKLTSRSTVRRDPETYCIVHCIVTFSVSPCGMHS
jgi:hypothetical protein